MKKVILLLAAMASMMTACTNNETLETTLPQAITFGNAFVEKATRSIDNSYNDKSMFETFQVYGTISNSTGIANIFNGERVVKGSSLGVGINWSYASSNIQYWVPGNTYNFKAVVDGNIKEVSEIMTDENGMPTIIKMMDASQQKDILYAEAPETKYNKGDQVNPVSFTFKHLMAKAMITVKNDIVTESGYSYKISNVKIINTAKQAQCKLNKENPEYKWIDHDDKYELAFGNIVKESQVNGAEAVTITSQKQYTANWERLFIPESMKKIEITFNRKLYKDDILIESKDIKVQSEMLDFKAGHAYNFLIKLGNPGAPITFTVQSVEGWEQEKNNEINNN